MLASKLLGSSAESATHNGKGDEGAEGGQRLAADVRIVAVDLQAMAPIEGVKQLQVKDPIVRKRHSLLRIDSL